MELLTDVVQEVEASYIDSLSSWLWILKLLGQACKYIRAVQLLVL